MEPAEPASPETPAKRKPGRPKKQPNDAWVSVTDLHQRYLKLCNSITSDFEKRLKKGEAFTSSDLEALTKLGGLVNNLAKEGRMAAKEQSLEADNLSDEELISELAPVFISLGWRPPPGFKQQK